MADDIDYTKIDGALYSVLNDHREIHGAAAADSDDAIAVSIQFEGVLSDLEALGFRTRSVDGSRATGVIYFRDIPRLTAAPSLQWMAVGRSGELMLDKAVRDMRARASSTGSIGTDGIWHVDVASGALTKAGGRTGAGVIVAVLDTGIDYTHPAFLKQLAPTKQTRILRIWDQSLTPAVVADCPLIARLQSSQTYGVEFDDVEINAALNGGPALATKDFNGHGTHVAATAAGGRLFPAGGEAAFVGVAPEADIIAVKMMDVRAPGQPPITYFTGPPGQPVLSRDRFRDAVQYCLRTAKALGKPVVINYSVGAASEAGDALDDDARWLDNVFDPAHAADTSHFPSGAAFVKSAGNDGRLRTTARIVIPASGQVTLPVALIDNRVGTNTRWTAGSRQVEAVPILASLWYRRANPFSAVSFAIRFPDQAAFWADMTVGGNLTQGYDLRTMPARLTVFLPVAPGVHRLDAHHEGNPSVPHPDGGSVRRHQMWFSIRPKRVMSTVSYYAGTYDVLLKGPQGTEIFFMGGAASFGPGLYAALQVATQMRDGSALDPAIQMTSEFSATDTGGRNVITVASYNDTDGDAAHADHHAIAEFSSRGPLRDFSDPPGSLNVIADKPDISAPGVKIKAALSQATEPVGVRTPNWNAGIRFIDKSGTSMSSPAIAGLCACLLEKDPTLTVPELITILQQGARPGVQPGADPQRVRAYGAGMVDGRQADANIP